MAKLLFLQIESESIDVGGFLATLNRDLSRAMELPALAVAAAPRMLDAPKRPRKAVKPARPAPPEKAESSAPAEPAETLADALREQFARPPMSLTECVEFARGRGYDTDSKRCSGILNHLRKRNEIYREDNDGRWHPAGKAERRPCAHV